MTTVKRHEKIMSLLLQERSVTVSELSELLQVTGKTIREDLEKLEEKGLLVRVRGGAVLADEDDFGLLPVKTPNVKNLKEKTQAAKQALTHIAEGDIIALDGGSTTLEIAKLLPNQPLTVIANDIFIISELAYKDRIRLVVPGGVRERNLLIGQDAVQVVAQLNIAKAFISATAIHPEYGLTTYTSTATEMKQAMIRQATDVYCVADHTKFGKYALMTFASVSEIGTFITDSGLSEEIRKQFAALGMTIETQLT